VTTVVEHLQRIPYNASGAARRIEVHSGLSRHYPRLHANLVAPLRGDTSVGLVMAHPTSDFLSHFLLRPLAEAGLPVLAVNTRYTGNEAALVMENAAADLGTAMRWMREELGYERVVLLGFSGGGSLASFYQGEAEDPRAYVTPAGDPADLHDEPLCPADALLLVAAHGGRARVLSAWIDPAVVDENDPFATDPRWDLYGANRSTPFDRDWVAGYRQEQLRRVERIDEWVLSQLEEAAKRDVTDRAFVVHRTVADPRFLDLTLDPSDRLTGCMYGDPRRANTAGGGLARFTTLRSWLSTWSLAHTNADTLADLARIGVPVLVVSLLADQAAFASESRAMQRAAAGRCDLVELGGLNHYLVDQPHGARLITARIRGWLVDQGLVTEGIR
jgi:pimeloyl-ACP methyl ester carboxylesterase